MRGLVVFGALVSTIALVGGGYVAITDYLTVTPPASVVSAYFTALERGDAARALSYGAVPDGSHAYLTDGVLHDQLAVGAIEDVQVVSVSQQDASAQVHIAYRLRETSGARSVTDVVAMVKRGRRWRLAETAVPTTVSLLQATHRAAVAGAVLPDNAPFAMFPGALPVTFDTPNLALNPSGSTVAFSSDDDSGQIVMPSSTGTTAARSAVAAALSDCLTGKSASAFCPQPTGTDLRAVPASLRGRLSDTGTSALKVEVTDDPDGVFEITGTVDVEGSYKSLNFDNIATVVTSSTILVPVSAHCYANAVKASLAWGAAP